MRIKIVDSALFLLALIFLSGISLLAQDKSDVAYNLSAQINAPQKLINASAKISFSRSMRADKQKVYLNLNLPKNNDTENIQQRVERITDSEGRKLKFIVDEKNKLLTVSLPSESLSKPIQTFTVEYAVPFSENDLKNLGYYLYPSHDNSTGWYPILLDKQKQNIRFADYDVSLSYPKDYEVLTSGLSIDKKQNDLVEARFAASHIEGFSLAFGENYRLQEVEKDGIRVSTFSSAELSTKFLEIAKQSADAAAWYQKIYGFFPTKNIGIVSGYKGASGGYPMPNIFMIHLGRLYSDFTQNTTAHELAHYYWGLYVFSDKKEVLDWLMLANGIWIDHVYLAKKSSQTLEAAWRGRNQELFNWFEFYLTADLANYEQRLDISAAEEKARNTIIIRLSVMPKAQSGYICKPDCSVKTNFSLCKNAFYPNIVFALFQKRIL